ncbi:MAG: alpha-2-macroglobulin family protein [Candidatus Thiodiazotropha sp.]
MLILSDKFDIIRQHHSILSNTYSILFSDNGMVEFPEKAPDTITSWVASAFALNRQTGLGVALPANVS